MARQSRPFGFDMTYRPAEEFFGPPMWVRVPSFVHSAVALAVIVVVFAVERGPKNTELYRYMYQTQHLIDAHWLAAAFAISGTASILRAGMRGVRVRGDWVEYRDVISSLWPKVKKFRWAQIDQITFEASGSVSVDLWDGSREFLPPVKDQRRLTQTLERVAVARAIPVRGGRGVDDLEAPLEDQPVEASPEA